MAPTDARIRVKDVYAHPVGRDAIDKVLLQLGRSTRWVTNPVVANLPLGLLGWLAQPLLGPGFTQAFLRLLADHPLDPHAASAASIGSTTPTPHPGSQEPAPWWHTAVCYQIYPRSFADSDGDGIGDLRGIISRLDHLEHLGVDCVWLSPIFDSPNQDMGYDVRDYRAVMAQMGTLADLDDLIVACHERGMRIILDLVVNHTSDQHPWFAAAIADPDGPDGDFYHLRPGRPGEDGSGPPPNNWTAFFGGSAWRWIPEAKRWALHLFAPGQMDLNWENPAVRAEVADIVQWWRDRGIDGFRLDVINYISKRPGLPDGHEGIGALMGFYGIEHYFFGPNLHAHLRELRRRGFTRRPGTAPPSPPAPSRTSPSSAVPPAPATPPPSSTARSRAADGTLGDPLPPDPVGFMVGETPGVGVEMGRLLSGAHRGQLDIVFNFDVLETPGRIRWDHYRYDLRHLKTYYQDYLTRLGPDDHLALFFENHDNPRMVSKVLGERARDPGARTAVAKVIATIQLLLPGTPFLFQGQEIGAIDQDFDSVLDLRDVESRNRFAELREAGHTEAEAFAQVLPGARDHARVPMRWEPGGGFTTGAPWQPAAEDSRGFTVAEQQADPDSVLNFYRDLIRLRRAHTALTEGRVRFLRPRARDYFAWLRTGADGQSWLVEINLTGRPIRRPRHSVEAQVALGSTDGHRSRMGPYEVRVGPVSAQGRRRSGRRRSAT